MARQGTIIGRKGSAWSSLAVGPANEIREKYKYDAFPGFEQVWYLDTYGGHKRKKGSPAPVKKGTKK